MADRPDLDFPPAEQEQPELFVAGLSHRTAPAELRDRILTEELAGGREELLRRLGAAGIAQALVLATCDRVEVLGAAAAPAAAAEAALAQLAERAGLGFSLAEPHAYRLVGAPALRHLFSVASSLDSMVVGEPQVLGQVKAAHRLAAEAGRIGPDLDACLQAAYAAAKRVRSETELAEQPVSLAAVAAKLARNLHGELSAAQALLIGFGEMGAVIARALQAHGLRDLWVASASPARGGAFAKELGARHRPVAELASALDHADIVIAAAASSGPVLGREAVDAALRRRRRRPMLLIDLGVPGDVAPEVDDLEDAFLYALDDLERIAEGGRARRDRAVAAATAILEEELERWSRERATRAAVPALVALRRHFERARAQVLAHGGGMDAEVATRLLVNRLLHEPTTALKALSAEPAHTAEERRRIERTLLKLFGVERRYGPAGDDDAQS